MHAGRAPWVFGWPGDGPTALVREGRDSWNVFGSDRRGSVLAAEGTALPGVSEASLGAARTEAGSRERSLGRCA